VNHQLSTIFSEQRATNNEQLPAINHQLSIAPQKNQLYL